MAQPVQQQQQQPLLLQQPEPQPSPQQSPAHSPIHQQQFQSFEDEPLQYDFFKQQPSLSEPVLPFTQTQPIPQTQSTSQPLPLDSAINSELRAFQDDLQVAQVLSDFTSNFNVDNSDDGCDYDLFCQPASNEPDNTQVHNQADDSFQQTISSPNTSINTTSQPTRNVSRKRSSSSLMSQPATLSSQKKQRVEPRRQLQPHPRLPKRALILIWKLYSLWIHSLNRMKPLKLIVRPRYLVQSLAQL